ncbi:MAG TPA: ParB/RepB/Spo0J family partition protein [Solirubrobacteraceae bacterium]|nr:ParB/RepB/Spo0J family partition protein [Solirubrobacteraceae bacterium]
MSQVDKLQDAEEQVAQLREEAERREREAREADLRQAPIADTADKSRRQVTVPLDRVGTMDNMRIGPLPELHELAVSIRETGLLQAPLVRETGDAEKPYELMAGRRRFGAMQLVDEAEGAREWTFTVVEGISRREALTMQFAENFHQNKPEPVQFARAAHAIMREDPSLTAADVSRLVGAPPAWTRKALRLLDLPENVVARVEQGDLAFTIADLVRRQIAKGSVSPEDAASLVEQHADGEISSAELTHGVGYVPPKPDNYDELSRKLDEARYESSRPDRIDEHRGSSGSDAEQRDWDAADVADGELGTIQVRRREDGVEPGGDGTPGGPKAEDLDAYALAILLEHASEERRAALGITDVASAHRYALALRPTQRLGVLRVFAAEIMAADPDAPQAVRAA